MLQEFAGRTSVGSAAVFLGQLPLVVNCIPSSFVGTKEMVKEEGQAIGDYRHALETEPQNPKIP